MRRLIRWGVPVAIGFAIAAIGFAYDLAFAGIPYQDPTPELEARWRFHSGVAATIELSGVTIALISMLALGCVGVWSVAKGHAEPGAAADGEA